MSSTSAKRADRTRERLIESHLPLVHSVARRYAGHGEPLDDLVQVGAVGLVKAGNRFDKSRGVAFAAFAAPAIEGEILRHLRDRTSPMRIPRDAQRATKELRRKRGALTAEIGHDPSTKELAAALDVDVERIERALRAELARDAVSLSGNDQGSGRPEGSDQQASSEERLSLARYLRALDERQRRIVFLRFHADMTERQIGRELGLSQAHVSRLLSGALQRLRAELAAIEGGGGIDADSAVSSVISPDFTGATSTEQARKQKPSASDDAVGGDKIAGVPAAQDTGSVEQYLELPYTVAVQSEREGQESCWTATVEELPGCAAQGRTPDEAVQLLRPAMESWLQAALAQRREIPVPGGPATKKPAPASHSGRFLVRMPGALHAELARAAEREQLSLNRLVTNVLAASVAPQNVAPPGRSSAAKQPADAAARVSVANAPRALRIALATSVAVVVLAAAAAIVLLVLALQAGI